MTRLRLIGTLAFLGIILLLFFSTQFESLPEGSKPPWPQKLLSISGESLESATFANKPLVVNFWASWCPPCRAEMPALAKTAREFQGLVNFIGVATDSPISELRSMQQEFQLPYPIVLGPPQMLKAWKAQQIPLTYFLNGDGEIIRAHRGFISEEELRQTIHLLIKSR